MAFTGAENMENDYMKRGYLLPKGCKDLNDVLKRKQKRAKRARFPFPKLHAQLPKGWRMKLKPWKPTPLPLWIIKRL